MDLLKYILIVLLFSGCSMQRYCNKRFPPQVVTQIHETIRDSIITLEIKPDTISLTDTILIQSETGLVQMPKQRLDTEFCYALSWITDSKLYFNLYQKQTHLDTIIEYKEIQITETLKVPTYFVSWWDGVWIRLGRLFSIALLLLILYRIIKFKIIW